MSGVLYDMMRGKFSAMSNKELFAKGSGCVPVEYVRYFDSIINGTNGLPEKVKLFRGWVHTTVPVRIGLGWIHAGKVTFKKWKYETRNRDKMYKYRKAILLCECCRQLPPVHTHHVIPIKDGGKEVVSNYQALCLACHKNKHPELPKGFIGLTLYPSFS